MYPYIVVSKAFECVFLCLCGLCGKKRKRTEYDVSNGGGGGKAYNSAQPRPYDYTVANERSGLVNQGAQVIFLFKKRDNVAFYLF